MRKDSFILTSKLTIRFLSTIRLIISRNYGGTGLGLWISKNIISLMHGRIKLHSKEHEGSNFILVFPVKASEEIATFSGSLSNANNPNLFKGKTCLVLDDIPENTYLTKEVLQKYGLHCICSQSGADALEKYKARHREIDMIITDLRMPSMSGQTFILEIRKFESRGKKQRTPIVVLTAESGIEEKKACLAKYGADAYLIKPIKYSDLVETLVKVCSAKNGQDKSENILIIDDDLLSSQFLYRVLLGKGHSCKLCHSIAEAKVYFEEKYEEPSVVLLDNLLGDGTGVDFLQFAVQVAKRNQYKIPKIISMSGNPSNDQRIMYQSYSLYVNGYLQKPISKRDLLELILVMQRNLYSLLLLCTPLYGFL
eukprot:TRINITY_DN1597_c0_g1_i1.p2 TRINITY_DN1597_c0_g1~~TRINITY_DN1597_c0_g1_i1.p2  ORF type:complete len:367 (+),score=35.34 TRINITY_DN1597_c0_g1_i1:1626-2726(+)